MDAALGQVVRNAAWWLVVGGSLGFIGACWPPYRQWYAPLEEGLRVIAGHPIGWKMIHAGFVTGIWMLVVGLVVLPYAMHGQAGGALALVAALLMAVAAVLWSLNIAYRLSVMVRAADQLVTTHAIFEGYDEWKTLSGYLFAGFSVLAYLSVATTGWLVLVSGLASRTFGWVLVAWGLSFGFVFGYNVPVMAYIPFMIVGGLVLGG